MILYFLLVLITFQLNVKRSKNLDTGFAVLAFLYDYLFFAIDASYDYDIWTYGWALIALATFLFMVMKLKN